jgi:hypothetical protein
MRTPSLPGLILALTTMSPIAAAAATVDSLATASNSATTMSAEPALERGARIRVTSPSLGHDPMVGHLVSVLGDTLSLEPEGYSEPLRARIDDRTRIEVSTGDGNHLGRGILIGALVGLSIDTAVAVRNGDMFSDNGGSTAPPLGLLIGAVLGGIIGANAHVDDWRLVPLPGQSHP